MLLWVGIKKNVYNAHKQVDFNIKLLHLHMKMAINGLQVNLMLSYYIYTINGHQKVDFNVNDYIYTRKLPSPSGLQVSFNSKLLHLHKKITITRRSSGELQQ